MDGLGPTVDVGNKERAGKPDLPGAPAKDSAPTKESAPAKGPAKTETADPVIPPALRKVEPVGPQPEFAPKSLSPDQINYLISKGGSSAQPNRNSAEAIFQEGARLPALNNAQTVIENGPNGSVVIKLYAFNKGITDENCRAVWVVTPERMNGQPERTPGPVLTPPAPVEPTGAATPAPTAEPVKQPDPAKAARDLTQSRVADLLVEPAAKGERSNADILRDYNRVDPTTGKPVVSDAEVAKFKGKLLKALEPLGLSPDTPIRVDPENISGPTGNGCIVRVGTDLGQCVELTVAYPREKSGPASREPMVQRPSVDVQTEPKILEATQKQWPTTAPAGPATPNPKAEPVKPGPAGNTGAPGVQAPPKVEAEPTAAAAPTAEQAMVKRIELTLGTIYQQDEYRTMLISHANEAKIARENLAALPAYQKDPKALQEFNAAAAAWDAKRQEAEKAAAAAGKPGDPEYFKDLGAPPRPAFSMTPEQQQKFEGFLKTTLGVPDGKPFAWDVRVDPKNPDNVVFTLYDPTVKPDGNGSEVMAQLGLKNPDAKYVSPQAVKLFNPPEPAAATK